MDGVGWLGEGVRMSNIVINTPVNHAQHCRWPCWYVLRVLCIIHTVLCGIGRRQAMGGSDVASKQL